MKDFEIDVMRAKYGIYTNIPKDPKDMKILDYDITDIYPENMIDNFVYKDTDSIKIPIE